MAEKRLIDANALCRYLSDWQLRCAGAVTGGQNARDNLVIHNTLDKVMEVIENATAEEQRVYTTSAWTKTSSMPCRKRSRSRFNSLRWRRENRERLPKCVRIATAR